MTSHPHNARRAPYTRIDEVPADVREAYEAGRMVIPREAFGGPTVAWSDLDWINVSRMPSEWEVGDVFAEWSIGRWVFRGEHDAAGLPLFTFEPKESTR